MAELSPLLNLTNAVITAKGKDPCPATADLRSGIALSELLFIAVPNFPPFDVDGLNRSKDNWVLWRSNIEELIDKINSYAASALSATAAILTGLDVVAIARDANTEMIQKITEAAVVVAILSGSPDVISKIKTLEKTDSEVLQRTVKAHIAIHGLTKPKRAPDGSALPVTVVQPGKSGSAASSASSTAPAAATGASGGVSTPSSSGALKEFNAQYSDEAVRRLTSERNEAQTALRQAEESLKVLNGRLSLLEQEREDLERKYKKLLEQESTKGSSTKERELQQAVAKRDETIAELRTKVMKAENERELSDSKCQEMCSEVSKLNEQLQRNTEQHTQLKEKLKNALGEMSIANDKAEANVMQRQKLETEVQALDAEKTAIAAKLITAKDALTSSKSEVAHLQKELAQCRDKISHLESDLVSRAVTVEGASDDSAGVEAIISSLREEIAAAREENERLRNSSASSKELEDAKQENVLAQRRIDQLQGEVQALMAARDAAKKEAAAAVETAKASLQTSSDDAEQVAKQKEQLATAKKAMISERFVLVSSVYELAVANVQQSLIAAAASSTPSSFGPSASDFLLQAKSYHPHSSRSEAAVPGAAEMTFLERQRKTFQFGIIRQLANGAAGMRPFGGN
jgi:predicted  nucleic acid-binding Zn-ribbon protein